MIFFVSLGQEYLGMAINYPNPIEWKKRYDNMIHLEECHMEAITDYKNGSIDKITPSQSSQKKKNKDVVNQIMYFS